MKRIIETCDCYGLQVRAIGGFILNNIALADIVTDGAVNIPLDEQLYTKHQLKLVQQRYELATKQFSLNDDIALDNVLAQQEISYSSEYEHAHENAKYDDENAEYAQYDSQKLHQNPTETQKQPNPNHLINV